MSSPFDQANPYVSPQLGNWQTPGLPARPLPTLCKIMFGLDIFFSVIRIVAVAFAVFALAMPEVAGNSAVDQTGIYEVVSGIGMILFGLVADMAMLLKQRWGYYLGWLKVAAVLASLAVGIWQGAVLFGQAPQGSPERVGMVIGAAISLAIRLGLLGAYTAAVIQFGLWSKGRESSI